MAHFDHSFGVEIECFMPEGQTRADLAAAINQRLGENACFVESYNHLTRPHWKLVTDGSLGDFTRGVEVVSPVLEGEADLAKVAVVCRALSDFGCTVNRKCSVHVHVGVGNAPLKFWKDIVSIYNVYEPVIDRMMPSSRRASNSTYCRSMTAASVDRIQASGSFSEVQRVACVGAADDRYYKVNMSAYLRHKTVEFRQHSGSTDSVKVCNWVSICLKMIDLAMSGQFVASAYNQDIVNRARRGTKNYLIGQLLMRPEGVTTAEACAATGWDSLSLAEHARICGIPVTIVKTGRVSRFFANRGAAIAPTIDSFASAIKMSAEEKAYVTQRTNDLSGQVAWAA